MQSQRASGFVRVIIIASVVVILAGLGSSFWNKIKEWISPATETTNQTTENVGVVEQQPIDDEQPSDQQTTNVAPTKTYEISSQGDYERNVPGWENRSYLLHIPPQYNASESLPVIIAIHGGGGNADAMVKVTCPDGNLNSSKCLNALADREGFIVVYPNGTANKIFKNVRTFNAGGGINGYACISSLACQSGIDDITYFNSLLDDLFSAANINQGQVYATGMSNGAAMSHRLACQLSNRITAIAPVGGGNQFSAVNNCNPARSVPMLQMHGTADPAWPYNGGTLAGGVLPDKGEVISIADTISGWIKRNGCANIPATENLPTIANDGTSVMRSQYSNCKNGANVVLYTINNGGHAWPQGNPYLRESVIGKTSQQLNANEVIWNFLKVYAK